ncbi:Josephin-domain-containing protein [Sparassis latifolia]
MTSLDTLIPVIYHEKQQPGSMLCAQHALNNLLQGNFFTAPDLSAIAESLDALEESYDADRGRASTNMDDTGFFSVQVLENALQVWGLTLIRWRSEAMRPYQQFPQTQMAFILNHEQHWLTLRRFGHVSPAPLHADSGGGHWFNLNSFLEAPQWISNTYLGMVLQQSEAEGYSVFAVIQTDPEGPLALPRTEADELAASIPESSAPSSGNRISTSRTPPSSAALHGFEDEDMELQAALQASLTGSPHDFLHPPSSAPSSSSAYREANRGVPPAAQYPYYNHGEPPELEPVDDEDDEEGDAAPMDPVAASMARNRAIMERMRREQEAALREGYEQEAARVEWAAAHRPPQAVQEHDDYEEMLRRAIEESEAEARVRDRPATQHTDEGEAADADENEDEDMDDEDYAPPVVPPRIPHPSSSYGARVYDDEDAELQAALKASLESVPEDFRFPSPRPPIRPLPPSSGASSLSTPREQQTPHGTATPQRPEEDTEDAETQSEAESSSAAEPEEQLSVEEIRKRRLAKFGG